MMTFKTAYLKLTIIYVSILMLISIFFSITIYQIASNELDRGFKKQNSFFETLPDYKAAPPEINEFDKIRAEQFKESVNSLKNNLIYFNIVIFIITSLGSYFMAKRTLAPIKQMMEAQNHFTADASHELRTPLTAMRTEIEVGLSDKNINIENAKNLLKSNLEEINKLQALSDALLKLAQYQENIKTNFKIIDIENVIVNAYEKIEKLALAKQINFKNNLKSIKIKGEEQSLVELFVILMDNAIKYSSKKSTVNITINELNKKVKVKISDHGIGIKATHIPYIFNRFYRADSSRNKEKIDGYGLGLSIAKKIVDIHHGNICVASKIGKGTQFIITLPKS